MKMRFWLKCGKSSMKDILSVGKIVSLSLALILAFFCQPSVTCTAKDLASHQPGIGYSINSQHCCCESGECCARKDNGCSAIPVDKVLPVSLKLSASRLVPLSALSCAASTLGQLANSSSPTIGCRTAGRLTRPTKLYLVHRHLLI